IDSPLTTHSLSHRLENERNACIETIEKAVLELPRRVKSAVVERNGIGRGDRIKEGHDLITDPDLHAFDRVPPDVHGSLEFRHELIIPDIALVADGEVFALILGDLTHEIDHRRKAAFEADGKPMSQIQFERGTKVGTVELIGSDVDEIRRVGRGRLAVEI